MVRFHVPLSTVSGGLVDVLTKLCLVSRVSPVEIFVGSQIVPEGVFPFCYLVVCLLVRLLLLVVL